MKQFKGTQGDWEVEDNRSFYNGDGVHIFDTVYHSSTTRAEDEANAKLIATAPELLDALVQVTQYLDDVAYNLDAQRFIDMGNAAIAKALGE